MLSDSEGSECKVCERKAFKVLERNLGERRDREDEKISKIRMVIS